MTGQESVIARFSRWLRQRPNSIEFWELVVTDRRVYCCFVGEAYRSMLLRADMGQRDRETVAETPPDELQALSEENVAVPLADLEAIRLLEATTFRRARLELEWAETAATPFEGALTLVSTSDAAGQRVELETLANHPATTHVDVSVTARRLPFI